MKLLWVFPSFEIGGAQRRFASLAASLESEFEHVVAAMDGCYAAEALMPPESAWRRCDVSAKKSRFFSSENIHGFAAVLRQEAPDMLVTTNWGTIEWRLANRKSRIPHIHIEDGFGADEALGERNAKRDIARRILFSRVLSNHDRFAFIAPSETMAVQFSKVWRVSAARLHVIPNGVDIRRFAKVSRHSTADPLVIGAVGALRREKRFDRLIRVFAAARKRCFVKLLLVGDGPERQELEALTRELGIAGDVTFAGAQTDVAMLLMQMDIFVIPSDTEQMPISLVEAMATGMPVVGSDVGDIAAMVSNRNRAHIHPSENEEAMAASILALVEDEKKRDALGHANAEKAAAEYSLTMMTERYKTLFQSLA